MRVEEAPDLPEIDITNLTISKESSEHSDPFMLDAEEVKSLANIKPTLKRSITNSLKKAKGASGVGSKAIDTDGATGYDALGVVLPPYNLDYLSRLYELSAAHHAAVDAKTANIVGLGYKLTETKKATRAMEELDGDEGRQTKARRRLERHREELIDIIEGFSVEETFTEVLVKMWRDYETTGNGYLEIGRNKDGTVGYVGHISSQTIRVRRVRDGFVQITGHKAVFFSNYGEGKTRNPINDSTPNEILHIKNYSPTNSFYGIPDIMAAQQALAGNEFASRFNLDYFENKAVPRHLITLKGGTLSANSQTKLLKFFETGLKGQNHRSLFIPLPADTPESKVEFKIEPVEAGQQDASFNAYRKSNQSEILMAHRVPVTKVSTGEGVSLAVARDADKTFKEQVVAPEQRILEKKLNRIIKEFSDVLELRLNEMTLTDEDTSSKINERNVKAGIETPNEVRIRLGKPAIKGGDTLFDLNLKASRMRAEDNADRERDSRRSANATDSRGEGRNPAGEGRTDGTE